MALFKFRKNADLGGTATDSADPVESVEALRTKTKHRLIGSAILVLAGVVIFSVAFDRQPRPIPVDVNIRIPSKDGQPPLVIGAAVPQTAAIAGPVSAASAATPETAAASAPVAAPAPANAVPAVAPPPVAPVVAQPAQAVAQPTVPVKPVEAKPAEPAKAAAKPEAKADTKSAANSEADRAKALLEGKAADAQPAASGERYVVQVGAFADVTKARQARLKLEKAGLKTYTQVAQTSEGKRIRVRVGPFTNRTEAEKAASKIKTLELPVAILTL